MEKLWISTSMKQNDKFEAYVTALQEWRNSDHEDHIWLSRNEVIVILEGIEKMEDREADRFYG